MQLERAEGHSQFPSADRQALLDRCRESLLWEPTASPVDLVKQIVEREHEQGKDVQVNSCALREDRLEFSMKERIEILNEAMSRVAR
jgi:hypothetical protein